MAIADLLTYAVLAYIGVRLVGAARTSVDGRHHAVAIVRGLRARHFLLAVPVLALVIVAASLLLLVPGLSFGWWTALGGVGNPVFGTSEHGPSGPAAVAVPALFAVLLVVGLPVLVEREEIAFRRGAEHRGTLANTRRAVVFGLVHALVGIPIGAALALSIGGGYLTAMYLRAWRRTRDAGAALLESTRAHLAYNLTIVAIVAVALALGA